MNKQVLITGGAGFVGAHVAAELLREGYRVRVLDSLIPQVHSTGPHHMGEHTGERPNYLDPEVELVRGEVQDPEAVRRALRGVDAVYHFASLVGVGQSMYKLVEYTTVNNLGTATLLEALIEAPVERLVVASSMSIYGEGLYRDPGGALHSHVSRTPAQLKVGDWELRDEAGAPLTPVPTPETKPPTLASVYALSKYDQERMCLLVAQAYGLEAVALRFFNIYGPYQALSNPYTGVLAIFAARYLNNKPPLVFEDGLQRRDFVNVRDVARACRLALEVPGIAGESFNIGSGRPLTVCEVAERMAVTLDKEHIRPEVTGDYRVGDIRHCFADITKARAGLGYTPQVSFEEGLRELAGWLEGQVAIDSVPQARAELLSRGLAV